MLLLKTCWVMCFAPQKQGKQNIQESKNVSEEEERKSSNFPQMLLPALAP